MQSPDFPFRKIPIFHFARFRFVPFRLPAMSTIMKLVDFGEGRSTINEMFVGCLKQYFPWKGSLSYARTFLHERIDVVLSRAKGD